MSSPSRGSDVSDVPPRGSSPGDERYGAPLSRSGGTGRRDGFKIRCPQGRVGSSPTSGTTSWHHSWDVGPSPDQGRPSWASPTSGTTLLSRARRHLRIVREARGGAAGPRFLVLFVTDVCNLACDHCFAWRDLNRGEDLTLDELTALADDLGPLDNLNLAGGEPFLRPDLPAVVEAFVDRCGVRSVYCPTSGWFTDRAVAAVRAILAQPVDRLVIELSFDGLPATHDALRGRPGSFARALTTYDALAALQAEDPRLRLHAIATCSNKNIEEIPKLADHLLARCPNLEHLNLPLLRGTPKDPSLRPAPPELHRAAWEHVQRTWAAREENRFGSLAAPVLQWTRERTVLERRQIAPCTAGVLTAVVRANGDVGFCEDRPPIGNLREQPFAAIWSSPAARARRADVRRGGCWCTNETFLWSSAAFHPPTAARAVLAERRHLAGRR